MKLIYLCLLALSTQAFAQLYSPSSSDISEAEAQNLFEVLKNENARMDEKSECHERAHMWALRAGNKHQIKMEKVYLFFTYKFQMRHRVTSRFGRPFTWWFHVAPAVRVNGELMVMDATFTDKPETVNNWARSLMKEPEDCVEMENREQYAEDRNISEGYRRTNLTKNQCYYIAAPRFFYQPLEMGFAELNGGVMHVNDPLPEPTEWRQNTFFWGLNSYKRSERRAVRQEIGF
ncbi:MAG: hypothetical protein LW878_12165 [Proteobacteria bacterium]|nr:hypothetical protein [Pseudomonadota bacterium]